MHADKGHADNGPAHSGTHAGTPAGPDDDALAAPAVARAMRPEARARLALRVVASTASTNTDLLAAAAALPSGTVLAAEAQTGGRGRRGRTWHAEPGASLAFSVLWVFSRPAAGLAGLSLVVGLAVAQALERCGAHGIRLRWPNDLLARRDGGWAKLGGILIELAGRDREAAAVIGIGLNVRPLADARGIGQPVTDLASLGVRLSRNHLLAAVLDELAAVLPAFDAGGLAPFAAAWHARHAFAGQRVTVAGDTGTAVTGVAAGIDTDGALLIDTADGRRRVITGDVGLQPPGA
ncbi:MAG: biotin--[acetyl-CoA-carboxylase] ligase [Burkholderiales bacterium]|nr:biotin--[acetyl-CoA-carboxylase] ligase [Burkholderiales bacterium]